MKIIFKYCVVVFFLSMGCSKDSEAIVETVPLNLEEVTGKYRGSWTWEFGSGLISMIVTSTADENRYKVEFYESENFVPMFNSDGITPEANGFLVLTGTDATIELSLNTDQPPCFGNYDGIGSRTNDGKLQLDMDIEHDCAEDAAAIWRLIKVEEL